jgi:NAD+ synthase
MTVKVPKFSRDVMHIDLAVAAAEIEAALKEITGRRLRKRGLVVAVSGGIDSALCAALAARAVGPERVRALLLPERDSSTGALGSTAKGKAVCEKFGITYDLIDLRPVLEAMGCYRWQDEAIRKLFPEYTAGDRFKITVAGDVLGSDRLNYFDLAVELKGEVVRRRMPVEVYLQMVAATNMKQRTRKLMEYSYADRLNYAVVGTPNRLEYDQGFFVRGGDGLADVNPIALLYKTQVYAMARHLGVPREVCEQTPSTDTYSLPQTQEEFYFALPYDLMDLVLWAYIHGVPAAEAARELRLTAAQVERAYRDVEAKRRASRALHQAAVLVREYDWGQGG